MRFDYTQGAGSGDIQPSHAECFDRWKVNCTTSQKGIVEPTVLPADLQ